MIEQKKKGETDILAEIAPRLAEVHRRVPNKN